MTEDRTLLPISRGILKFARQIGPKSVPVHVKVEPVGGCVVGDCFDNVAAAVRLGGGSVQHGWKVREQPSVFVEGEFYAVWRRATGDLIDVTPRPDGMGSTVFIADPQLVWDGDPVEPRRLMLHEQPCYCGSMLPFNICHALAEDSE